MTDHLPEPARKVKRRGELRLVPPPPAELLDTRLSVALTLLGPIQTALDDYTTHALGGIQAMDDLESDPRYVIGRLHQALTALLADHVPPMDATAVLLSEAIDDAITYRRRSCGTCGDGICAVCWQHWRKADQYEALYGDLGIIAEEPPSLPDLTVVRPESPNE